MIPPRITKAMLRASSLIYQTPDEHAFLKILNDVIEAKFNSDLGNCPHKPVDTRDVKLSGDLADRFERTILCCYCGEELVEVKTYKLKCPLPSKP